MAQPATERPAQAAEDWTIPQDWEAYTPQDHAMWDRLFARQAAMLPGRAVKEFMVGLDVLRLSKSGIPDFAELSERLMKLTGWQVVAVPGLVPGRIFFEHLANRRFVAGRFIRTPEQLDYLQEPDVFHDVFGHVPLLAHPAFADYMQAYGEGGLRADGLGAIDRLARLYWYTVEFGLIRQGEDLKLYGAGILSSYGESVFALDDPSPNRVGFNLKRLMRTHYLLRQTVEMDFAPLYEELQRESDLGTAEIIPQDIIFNRGTQAYARSKTGA
jgi:phenylalanine-4-hydroxylase